MTSACERGLVVGLVLTAMNTIPMALWAGEPLNSTHYRDLEFYRNTPINVTLTGSALTQALEVLTAGSGEITFPVLVLNSLRACRSFAYFTEQWEHAVGQIIELDLSPPFSRGVYHLNSIKDFGGLEIEDLETGKLNISWYICARDTSYSVRTDATNSHFVFAEDGMPLWGWSIVQED